jgi:hypothetical protein
MQFAKVENGIVVALAASHEFWPDIGFPPGGPSAEFLVEQGYYRVVSDPAFDPTTQKLISATPYYDVDSDKVYDVVAVALTEEELDERAEAARNDMVATNVQIRRGLRAMNLKATFNAWLETQSEDVREDFDYANEIRRQDTMVEQARVALGWTKGQMDEFFLYARTM